MLPSRRLTILGAALLATFLASPAIAQAPDLAEAKRHFKQGVALFNDGDYNGALAEFESAYKSHASAGVLYNIGLTQKALFRYPEAIDSLTRYMEGEKKLSAEKRREAEQIIAEIRALLADVSLSVVPDGAVVILDGRTLGAAPIATLTVAAGRHVFEISAEGYKPARREVVVSAGTPLALSVKLEAVPKSAKVRIRVAQAGAVVRVDGNEIDAEKELELLAGGHALEVSASGFTTHRSELVVAAGQDRAVDVVLEKPARKERLYEKWWIWTLGVVVAGGVAAAIAIPLASGTQEPLVGTLNPGAGKVN